MSQTPLGRRKCLDFRIIAHIVCTCTSFKDFFEEKKVFLLSFHNPLSPMYVSIQQLGPYSFQDGHCQEVVASREAVIVCMCVAVHVQDLSHSVIRGDAHGCRRGTFDKCPQVGLAHAGHVPMLYLYPCWTWTHALPGPMLDLYSCWTCTHAGPVSMLDLYPCWTCTHAAGPVPMLCLSSLLLLVQFPENVALVGE